MELKYAQNNIKTANVAKDISLENFC